MFAPKGSIENLTKKQKVKYASLGMVGQKSARYAYLTKGNNHETVCVLPREFCSLITMENMLLGKITIKSGHFLKTGGAKQLFEIYYRLIINWKK